VHTTNYFNTFITVSEDCPAETGIVPPVKEKKTIARIQYDLLINSPYAYSSDDIIYISTGERKGISREEFFSKGQACMRSSPLVKKYGWGIHSNEEGRIAIYAVGTDEYLAYQSDERLRQLKGMRSSRK
jgi:hypothetical protein